MIELIQKRLTSCNAANQLEEEYVIKEILQEIALYGLWRGGFFDIAAFQGGTCLRILNGMTRFSEDLDFILKKSDPDFTVIGHMTEEAEGCNLITAAGSAIPLEAQGWNHGTEKE